MTSDMIKKSFQLIPHFCGLPFSITPKLCSVTPLLLHHADKLSDCLIVNVVNFSRLNIGVDIAIIVTVLLKINDGWMICLIIFILISNHRRHIWHVISHTGIG